MIKKKKKKKISNAKKQTNASMIEQKLREAAEKAENKIVNKLEKPLEQMSEDEILFLDKQLQLSLGPTEKAYIGKIRRDRIMDYLIKIETSEISMKKTDIAKAVNITPNSLSVYINHPDFQADYRRKCLELADIMQAERVSYCRRIAINGLCELDRRSKNDAILAKLGTSTIMDMVTFAVDLERKEMGTDIKTTKVIHEGNIDSNVNISEQIKDESFRKEFRSLLKKTSGLQVLAGGKNGTDG